MASIGDVSLSRFKDVYQQKCEQQDERINYLEAQRQKLESERALLDAYSYQIAIQCQQPIRYVSLSGITGGTIIGGVPTIKSDKLDEDFFKVELPKLNQEN